MYLFQGHVKIFMNRTRTGPAKKRNLFGSSGRGFNPQCLYTPLVVSRLCYANTQFSSWSCDPARRSGDFLIRDVCVARVTSCNRTAQCDACRQARRVSLYFQCRKPTSGIGTTGGWTILVYNPRISSIDRSIDRSIANAASCSFLFSSEAESRSARRPARRQPRSEATASDVGRCHKSAAAATVCLADIASMATVRWRQRRQLRRPARRPGCPSTGSMVDGDDDVRYDSRSWSAAEGARK